MPQTILIIRHAEKPEPDGAPGVDATGNPDPKSLTPVGWQRAGAWVGFFVPALTAHPVLQQPNFIYASAPEPRHAIKNAASGSKSRRPLETVTPLASRLGIEINLGFSKGDEADLAGAIARLDGVVLVCWQHEDIIAIANAIEPRLANLPEKWPGDRFNVMFRLDRPAPGSSWVFQQIVPVLLGGDLATEI